MGQRLMKKSGRSEAPACQIRRLNSSGENLRRKLPATAHELHAADTTCKHRAHQEDGARNGRCLPEARNPNPGDHTLVHTNWHETKREIGRYRRRAPTFRSTRLR